MSRDHAVSVDCAAKKHHPDVNPGDASAAERFKFMTSAYTQALLISSKRDSTPYANCSQNPKRAASQARAASPHSARRRDDNSRFNHREWDHAHYGLRGDSAEVRQSEYIRNLTRAQRMRSQQAGAARNARSRASGRGRVGGGGYSFAMLVASAMVCFSTWSAVYSTTFGRHRPGR